jgi:hypothetical protein
MVTRKLTVFWDVMPCIIVNIFEEPAPSIFKGHGSKRFPRNVANQIMWNCILEESNLLQIVILFKTLACRFPVLPDFLRSSGSGRGALSRVSTIEELLGRNSSGSRLEN